jgi:hypothetical protein
VAESGGGDRLAENPFFVLGVSTDASRIEVEREAQKLLGMLELGFAAAATYATPIGVRARTPEAVRAAVAALRDPQQRLVAELWARHAPAVGSGDGAGSGDGSGSGSGSGSGDGSGDGSGSGDGGGGGGVTRRRLGWV